MPQSSPRHHGHDQADDVFQIGEMPCSEGKDVHPGARISLPWGFTKRQAMENPPAKKDHRNAYP
jgi:hypothetical protein